MSPSKILIEGLDDGIEVSLAYRSIEDLYGKNIFLVDEKEIANTLKKYQKNISLIQIDRLYPNGLKILLSGYPIIFDIQITTIKERKWWMTENGILIPKENLEEIPLYSIEYIDPNLSNDEILDYKELLIESDAQTIKKTLDTFQEAWPDITIQKISYLKRENEMHLFLKNNTRILITLQDFTEKTGETKTYNNVRLQLLWLKAYIEKNREPFINWSYTYIDARIPGKIFSCRDKEVCMKNLKFIYPDMSY
jgi:hypothetical protein